MIKLNDEGICKVHVNPQYVKFRHYNMCCFLTSSSWLVIDILYDTMKFYIVPWIIRIQKSHIS